MINAVRWAGRRAVHWPGRWRLARTGITLAGVTLLLCWGSHEPAPALPGTWHAVLLGVLLSQLSFACYAGRFRAVMRIVEVELAPAQSLRLSARALFYHFLVPLSVGSDLTRFALCRAAAPRASSLLVAGGIVCDHAIGTLALLLIGASAWAFVPGRASWQMLGGLSLACLLIVGAVGFSRLRWPRHTAWCSRRREHWPAITEALLLSLLMQGILALAVYTGAQAWHLGVGYSQILWVLACSALLQCVPFNFGGLHLGDVAGTALYASLGLPLHDALLLGSLLYCYRVLMAVIGGLWDLQLRPLPQRDSA